MSYIINDTDLSIFGITAIRNKDSIALSGIFDFPGRDGTTEHEWGTETEAFVSAADLKWKERDIVFAGLMMAETRTLLLQNLTNFSTLCKSDLLSFETPYGTFDVVLKEGITTTKLDDTSYNIEVRLTEQEVAFSILNKVASGGTGYLLSGYNLQNDFGIYVPSITGQLDTPERIEVGTTDYYRKTGYRKPQDITIKCVMIQSNMDDLTNNMNQFLALLSSEGLKEFIDSDGAYSVYVKDGFTTTIYAQSGIAKFNLKLRAV